MDWRFVTRRPSPVDSVFQVDDSYANIRIVTLLNLMALYILESRTPLSCSTWSMSRSALVNPGCSSACDTHHQPCLSSPSPVCRTNIFESKLCLTPCVRVRGECRLYAVAQTPSIHLRITYSAVRSKICPEAYRRWRSWSQD